MFMQVHERPRMASMRAMISAAIFSLNHSCLFLIANVMSSKPDRSFLVRL